MKPKPHQSSFGRLIVAGVGCLLVLAASAQAQYTADFQTNLISGVTSNWFGSGGYYVGNAFSFDVLLVQSNGSFRDVYGYIGYSSTSSNNSALVTGSGSAWSNDADFYVGYSGSGNSLVVSNGGNFFTSKLFNLGCNLGFNFGSFSNTIVISGSGSTWNNAEAVCVGYYGAWNRLRIEGGALVCNTNGYVGYYASSSNNSVVVTGVGSVWTNRGSLSVGYSGAGNSLVVSNGGNLFSGDVSIGNDTNSSNIAQVIGGESLWSGGRFYVGNYGSDNRLKISGGMVLATNMVVGYYSCASNNGVEVNSGALVVTNSLATGRFVIGRAGQGSLILNGGTVTVDHLIVTNSLNSVVLFNQGLLRAGNAFVTNGSVFVVGDGTNSATLYMTGGAYSFFDGLWIRTNANLHGCGVVNGSVMVEGDLRMDCSVTSVFTGSVTNYGRIEAANSSLLVFDGPMVNYGQIVATNGVVQYYSGIENHGTLVGNIQDAVNRWNSSSGGKWENASNWSEGLPTNWHRCAITNAVSKTVTIDSSTVNTHPGSLLIDGLLVAAPEGVTNILSLSDPGLGTPLRTRRELVVDSGGVLSASHGSLEVGSFNGRGLMINGEVSASGSSLILTNGPTWVGESHRGQMTLLDSTALAGEITIARSNDSAGVVMVVGSNAVWNSNSNLYVGWYGGNSSLLIGSGGRMINSNGYVAYFANSSNNVVVVADGGSVWTNGGLLRFGYSGPGNSLIVSNGGQVLDSDGRISFNASSSNNSVLVTDPGSIWNNSGSFCVGYSGGANSLIISNGGQVLDVAGRVGDGSLSNNVLITGAGSIWTNKTDLSIGNYGAFNRLIIDNGGRLTAKNNGYVGYMLSRNNTVIVTDLGSVWSCGTLTVGNIAFPGYGSDNSLVITNGGKVVSLEAQVGYSGDSNNVLVTGSSSIWSNGAAIYVGVYGNGNGLVIRDGGQVFTTEADLGEQTGSKNIVFVTGSESLLKVAFAGLAVGLIGTGNSLVISSGGTVDNDPSWIGYFGESTSNSVHVQDGGFWHNGTLVVGNNSSGNSLIVTDGFVYARSLLVGAASIPCDNLVQLDSGSIIVTNETANAVFEVRNGKLTLDDGMATANVLILTNRACSVIEFNGGLLNSSGTVLSNSAVFAVGNGVGMAEFHLVGGVHSFANGLQIHSYATLSGCGTISGSVVVDPSGMVLTDCGGTLTFTGIFTNNGTLRAVNGTSLEFYGPVVNNGLIDVSNGNTNFHSAFINNGIFLDAAGDWDGDGQSNLAEFLAGTDPTNSASAFRITEIRPDDDDMLLTWTAVGGKWYVLQTTTGFGGSFSNDFVDLDTAFLAYGTGETEISVLHLGAATNGPARFYRVRLVP